MSGPGARVRLRSNCLVRAAPGRGGAALGLARKGDCLPAGPERDGWRRVAYRGQAGWVAGRFCERNTQSKPMQ